MTAPATLDRPVNQQCQRLGAARPRRLCGPASTHLRNDIPLSQWVECVGHGCRSGYLSGTGSNTAQGQPAEWDKPWTC